MLQNEVHLIKPKRYYDHRGFFTETYNKKTFIQIQVNDNFIQDNHSFSHEAKTLRGLHFQSYPNAQAKLVRCVKGSIFDVVVDIRKGSPKFGTWLGYELNSSNGHQLYIPIGFAHGFVTLEPNTEIVYKCSDYYNADTERAIRWNDQNININWPFEGIPILSDKDREAPLLKNMNSPFKWNQL